MRTTRGERKVYFFGLASMVLSILGLSGAACSSDSGEASESGAALPSPDDGGEGRHRDDAKPTRAEFGLDQRPSNATCLAPARPAGGGRVKLEKVFDGLALDAAMALAQPPDDGSRWFVAERAGRIVSFPAASPPRQPRVVVNLSAVTGKPILTADEGGLLNLAFHPRFAENGRLFVSFTTTGAPFGSEVGYLTSTDNGATFSSYTKVLGMDRPSLFHCGGGLGFGPDGLLYLSFGDAAKWPDGQSTDGFSSKVLRIDVDDVPAGETYGIPDGNPYKAGGGEPAAFAYGFRNPFRLSVDRETGDVWLGDVGTDRFDEINLVRAGGNYGWACREGAHDYDGVDNTSQCEGKAGFVDPVVEHENVPPGRAIIGGVVYRGKAMPWFHGTYVYGDYRQLEARALTLDPATGAPTSEVINEDGPNKTFVHFAEDAEGEIYAVTVYQSEIYKLVPTDRTDAASTFPDRLSKTGCVDPADPSKPAEGLVPFRVNSELWSDGADKERYLALPDGKTISVGEDGHFEFPVGSVLVKTFSLKGKRVETRLLVHHDDGEWGGYTYEWDDAQKDAVLLPAGKTKTVGAQKWTFPSRGECVQCHTAAAGRTLGPEIAQLNGEHVYPSTNRIANQLKTLEYIGMLSAPLGASISELPAYPALRDEAPLDARARSYLHANCSNCHRPESGGGRATMDLRYATRSADTKTCGAEPVIDDLGIAGAKIVAPGSPDRSVLSRRVHSLDAKRMPPLGTRLVDEEGVKLLDAWIRETTCP
jgi:uncharacterized repeat protein (TIGR03806 family)